MKKYIVAILFFLMLTSCKNERFEQDLTHKFKETAGFDIEAEISAEFDDRTDNYTVMYNYQKGNNAKVRVVAPEEIAGIEAIIDGENGVFKFKDTVLETGIDFNSPTPMNVIHKLVNLWSFKEGSQYGSADENVLIVYDEGDYQYRTIFNKELLPICADVMRNSKLMMKIDFIKCEGIANAD